MKLKISIPQILARKVTHPRTDADEIYIAYFITLAKADDKTNTENSSGARKNDRGTLVRKYVAKKISNIKNGVKNGKRWTPEDVEVEIDTGDAYLMYINMALYEEDDGAIYKKLKHNSNVLINPEDFDWSCIEIPADFTNIMSWAKSIWKLVVGAFNYFRQDDLLGEQSIVINLKDENLNWLGYRELKFKKFGGDYRVQLSIDEVKDKELWE